VHQALEPAHLSLWLGRAEQLSPTRVGFGGLAATALMPVGAVMPERSVGLPAVKDLG
jgi:hypothetical protein